MRKISRKHVGLDCFLIVSFMCHLKLILFLSSSSTESGPEVGYIYEFKCLKKLVAKLIKIVTRKREKRSKKT